jgi:hypothetical protein
MVTTVVTVIFAALVFARWRNYQRRGRHAPHLLAWGFGLSLYAVAAAAQVLLYFVWSPLLLALWYWSGVLMTAAWLGQGSVHLLVRRGHIARYLTIGLSAVTLLTLPWLLFGTQYNPEAWAPGMNLFASYRELMHSDPFRGLVAILNAYGTIGLVGGAIYSAVLFRRKQILRNRMIGNWLIAAGGLLPALSGTFNKFGLTELNYPSLLVGVLLIFAGFLLATQAQDAPARASRRWAKNQAGAPSTPR